MKIDEISRPRQTNLRTGKISTEEHPYTRRCVCTHTQARTHTGINQALA